VGGRAPRRRDGDDAAEGVALGGFFGALRHMDIVVS
jgi:hypothetical protein